jgi:hypothetical protein
MMIGRFGGSVFQRAASARRSAAPCSAGSLKPCSFKVRGPVGGDDVEERRGAGPVAREIDLLDQRGSFDQST